MNAISFPADVQLALVTAPKAARSQMLTLAAYLALAGPGSSFTTRELTSHAQTAIWLIGRFLPVHFVTEREGGLYRISTVA